MTGTPAPRAFIQRFGGALNLNPHPRSLVPDGLFAPGPAERLTFAPLPRPADEEHVQLARSMGEAMIPVLSPGFFDAMPAAPTSKPLCSNVEGFGLHAARTVAARDRVRLDQLCRYVLRAPFS